MSKCDKCDAHEYLEQSLGEMKQVDDRFGEILISVRLSITKLTENLQETKRTNERLEKLLMETKEEAESTRKDFGIFKTRIYAYGSAAVAVGSGIGWVGDRVLKFFVA